MSEGNTPSTIFVKGLPTVIEDCDLREAFSGFGPVQSASIARLAKDGQSLGYGFVTFLSYEKAEAARSAVNGQVIDCKHVVTKLTVQHCGDCTPRRDGSRSEGRKLYVSHFGDLLDSEGLEKMFSTYGTVTAAQVVLNNFTNESRGFGFVTFENAEDAEEALSKMHGMPLPNQKNLCVEFAHEEQKKRRGNRYGRHIDSTVARFPRERETSTTVIIVEDKENWCPNSANPSS